ncbi:MAG: hypothetical protein EOP88_11810 [Verrucomicrobiaceae bacterium]|nr:MAG: hypothetical protein EOP88_11810 [Verrucomicrobiaceae bacterium]
MPAAYEAPQQPAYAPAGYEPLPQPTAAPAPAAYEPPPLSPQPSEQQPPVLLVPESVPSYSPALVRPEPRQLPQRSSSEPVAKQMPEPTPGGTSSKRSNPLPRHPRRKGPFARFMLLFLFLIASVALVFGVLTVLNNQTKDPAPAKPLLPPVTSSSLREGTPPTAPTALGKPNTTPETKTPVLPVPEPAQPQIVEPVPELPEGMEPVSPSSQAREVLDKFLAAKTLAERLPLIETKTAQAELEASCLARPLPAADKIYIDMQESIAIERVSDFYHSVDFIGENNQLIPHIILVRIRGASSPKVVVDPFLDTYGGRLAGYAKAPVDQAGVFQITVSALASCYNENVPNREKKLTLKLLPRDNEKAIAEAYFGRQSEIGLMLEDGTYSLSYGKAKACTVMLRWNKEDNPEKPYLEAIKLNRLDWNP